MAIFKQVSGKPREEEIGSVKETTITGCDVPHVGRAKDHFPRHRRSCIRINRCFYGAVRVASAYVSQLSSIDVFVFFRKVAIERVKSQRPQQACSPENVENGTPAERDQNTHGDERRDGDGKPAEAMRDAMHAAASCLS